MSLPQTPYSANERLAFTSPMYAKQSYDPYAVDTPGRAETTSFLSPSTSRVNHLPYAARDAGTPLISVIEGRTKRLSWALVLPAVVVFLVTAGAATTMLAWMHLHKEQSSLREVWEQKAFVLSEGVKEKDGFKVAKLLGLTISSAASSAVGITTPILTSLYAFRTAHAWLTMSTGTDGEEHPRLPTPLQYGLLLQLLSSSGVVSLMETARYLLRPMSTRARATVLLVRAFLVALLIYVITHAICAVDIWLHVSTFTVLLSTSTPIETPLLYGVGQQACPPYPAEDFSSAIYVCLMSAGYWKPGFDGLREGMLTASNSSATLRPITLAEASGLAVMVRPNIPEALSFRMLTFGARATCESVNEHCDFTNVNDTCTGFPSYFPPVKYNFNSTSAAGLQEGQNTLKVYSSNCAWDNPNCKHISSDKMTTDGTTLNARNPPANAYNLWMQFLWRSEGDTGFGLASRVPKDNTAISEFGQEGIATMVTNCTLSFYNVTLDYFGGNYTLVSEELSNVALSDGLAGPVRFGHPSTHLLSNVEGHVFTDNTTSDVMNFLQHDLARLALASSAWMTNLTMPTTMQARLDNKIVGQYPFWPVILFITLLYVHAVIALVIFTATAFSKRTELLRVQGVDKPVSALELAQLRLTSPLAAVAAMFSSQRPAETDTVLSVRTSALDLFGEREREERLRVGLKREAADSPVAFGLWRGRSLHANARGEWAKA